MLRELGYADSSAIAKHWDHIHVTFLHLPSRFYSFIAQKPSMTQKSRFFFLSSPQGSWAVSGSW